VWFVLFSCITSSLSLGLNKVVQHRYNHQYQQLLPQLEHCTTVANTIIITTLITLYTMTTLNCTEMSVSFFKNTSRTKLSESFVDYSQHYNNNNNNNAAQSQTPQQSYRRTPSPVVQTTQEEAPKRGNSAYIQNSYSGQDIYQPSTSSDYNEDNSYNSQVRVRTSFQGGEVMFLFFR
jgi:hypothetical protein